MHRKIFPSFKYAFAGIWAALHEEHNLLVQFYIGILGAVLGKLLSISKDEWILGMIVWGLVFSMELTNTAIEEVVNSFVVEYHPGAKKAKDIAAAAVMVVFFVEVVVGLFIFLPHILG